MKWPLGRLRSSAPPWEFLDRQLALDARSLALGRMGVAALLLYDLALRATDLSAHYSDLGVAPRDRFALETWSFVWSLHALAGGMGYQACLFALAAATGAALLVGAFTRWATLVSLLLALSLQGRNPFLHDGQDDLLRVILFWSLWLPLGRKWSLDAALRRGASGDDRVSGLLALGLTVQLTLMYLSSASGKLQCAWWRDGVGILRALQLGRYETAAGQWLATFPGPLRPASYLVVAVELVLPVLLWLPWRRARLRQAAVVIGVSLHLGFGLFLRLSIFPGLAAALWAMFAPTEFWGGRAQDPLPPPNARPAWLALPFLALAAAYVANTHATELWLPAAARRTVEAVGLQQYWVVFSPPRTKLATDGWIVAEGLRADGRRVDLLPAEEPPVSWERPALISATFRDSRWRHFYANLVVEWARGSSQQRELFAVRDATVEWLCRDHAARFPQGPRLLRANVTFVEHPIEDPTAMARRRVVATGPCP